MEVEVADRRARYRASEQGRAENRERMRRRRARLRACGSRAQERLRRQVNWLGWALCRECGLIHRASDIEIDHVLPVTFGGCDTDDNVQTLCVPCHVDKTNRERACA